MDITTIIGIVFGIAMLVLSVQKNLILFWNIPSLMITFGGAFAATLINYPLSHVLGVMRVTRKAFFTKPINPFQTIDMIVGLGEKARREGILALDHEISVLKDEFLRRGLQHVVDGTDRDLLKERMEKEIAYLVERHKQGQEIFVSLGTYTPAFGMVGTLMGLVMMLYNLDDPKKVGPGMAVAIITTFYGAMAAYLVFLPIAGKLKVRSNEEVLLKEVILEGVMAIQGGESPRIIGDKLKAYIAPRLSKSKQPGGGIEEPMGDLPKQAAAQKKEPPNK